MKYILVVYTLIGMYACAGRSEPTEENATPPAPAKTADQITITPEQQRAMNLQIGSAEQTTVNDEVKATGTVDVPPQYMASISVPIGGIIRSVGILPGQRVTKGQTLATLQSLDYIQMQQDYLQAVSQLTYLQAELQRQQTLNAEDVGARKRLQQAEADFGSNRALVRSLALKLQTLGTPIRSLQEGNLSPVVRITSPINGFVTATNIHLGQQVATTDVLMQVMDQTHKHLELSVYESDAFKIRQGQTILLNDVKLGAATVRGTVYLVGKAFEGEARTITIHGHVTNQAQEQRLIPGMFLSARILTGSRTALMLPEAAVVRKGQNGFIYVPIGHQIYRRVPVKIGISENGRTEVMPRQAFDLAKVVIQGAYLLEAEMTKGEGEEE